MARYIDADKLIAERTIFMQDEEAFDVSVVLVSDIKLAPTADVAEVKHGEWMCKDEKGNGVCSNCNRQDNIDPLATHCRYCGAKMDK